MGTGSRDATVDILGVQVSCVDLETLIDQAILWAEAEGAHTISYVNAHCLNTSCRDPEYRQLLNETDLVYADGVGVVWASRFLGGCQLQKMTGADWIYDFCAAASEKNILIYILAGKPGVADRAKQALVDKWPELDIVGVSDGYFIETSEAETLLEIQRKAPHVLFVGLGAPQQEKWVAEHRQELGLPVCWTVGALFDYLAGEERRVPSWMYKLNLEWLWRLLVDPAAKWRRYVLGNPEFVLRVLRQKFKSELTRG